MKTLKIITIAFLIICILSTESFALSKIFEQVDNWESTGKSHKDDTMDGTQIEEVSNNIYNFLLAIGTGIAVVVGAFLGIKYMTAGIEDKAKIKETLIPYLISCVVLFGAFGIWKVAIEIAKVFK